MSDNILEKIIKKKIEKIDVLKKTIDVKSLNEIINKNNSFIDFKNKINNNLIDNKSSIIAEIKKASPSAGVIIDDYNPVEIAKIYQDNKVTCLSVLTEEDFFLGNLIHISKIKDKINLPILCKDFFVDPYQVYEASMLGAHCILILLKSTNLKMASLLYDAALDCGLDSIIEVHNENEMNIALQFKESIIGINNRNLETFDTSLETTIDICKKFNLTNRTLICESGINTGNDIKKIINATGITNFLVGESLIKSDSINQKLKELTS